MVAICLGARDRVHIYRERYYSTRVPGIGLVLDIGLDLGSGPLIQGVENLSMVYFYGILERNQRNSGLH
jgi:hypothetical protein